MKSDHFDIVIIGAGPAGCTCAYQLAGKGLEIAILDKDVFPRDKICGDALSADVINQLFRMNEKLGAEFLKTVKKKGSHGVRFFSPNQRVLDIDFINQKHIDAPGYVAKRRDFDQFYFNQIKDLQGIHSCTGDKVEDIVQGENEVFIKTTDKSYTTKLIVGADGANSIVNRKLAKTNLDKNHHCAGVRQYYKNVSGFNDQNYIELHFYKDILPGYFWIFPLPDHQANVGLGILSSEVSKRRIDLKAKLTEIIHKHPNVKHRFKDAAPMESIKGFGLPIGSKKRPCSGDRYLLLGDAASLIDPFTGEGIGNAIRSGRIAADHILKAFEKNRFDSEFNSFYDKEIYSKMWSELRVSRSMQKLLKYPIVVNFLIRKANKSESVRKVLSSMLDNIDLKKELIKPSFYFQLLFN